MPCSLIVRTVFPAAAVLSLLAQPAWAGGPECWNPDELPAAQLHAFHTALMVGALRCRSERPDALSSYNAFVEARKSSINAARTVVEARFIRDKGAEVGLAEFKNFDTEIANRASIAGADGMPCDGVDTYSRLAVSASQGDLYTLARLSTPGAEIRSCGSEPKTLAVAAPAPKTLQGDMPPEQAVVTPAIAHEQSGDVSQPEMQPASQTQEIASATPPQKAATGETVAAQRGNADPAKALEDAARALAEAASSLRTASAANP